MKFLVVLLLAVSAVAGSKPAAKPVVKLPTAKLTPRMAKIATAILDRTVNGLNLTSEETHHFCEEYGKLLLPKKLSDWTGADQDIADHCRTYQDAERRLQEMIDEAKGLR